MKKRIIKVTATFNMSEFQENTITPKEKVKKMVMENMIEEFGWDEGYEEVIVDVIDIP